MEIKKVWIVEGCASSGICEKTCPEVFELPFVGDVAQVIEDADLATNRECIITAAESCPTGVIRYSQQEPGHRQGT
jgi:ferredoxin